MKRLTTNNNFPKTGLVSMKGNGENLLIKYLESITKIEITNNINIKSEKDNDQDDEIRINKINQSWIIHTDFPYMSDNKYYKQYYNTDLSSGILLIRNPVDYLMNTILYEEVYDIETIRKYIKEQVKFYNYWIQSPIPTLIVRYEDLISNTYDILYQISCFLFGIETIESTYLVEDIIFSMSTIKKEDFLLKDKDLTEDLIDKKLMSQIQLELEKEFFYLLFKFNYENQHRNDDDISCNTWLIEFNKLQIQESIVFNSKFDEGDGFSEYVVLNIR